MHSRAEYERVAELLRSGMNDCQVSRATGISRCTVREWRTRGAPGRRRRDPLPACPRCEDGHLERADYAYLLGLYLGDGCLSRPRRVWTLRIVQDARYRGLIAECARVISSVSGRKACFVHAPGCIVISSTWNHWPCLFPQHGPGRKHMRTIELAPWQSDVAADLPHRLLAGLIHSDGCRVLNTVNGTAYPRYHFINFSEGIRRIYTDACDALGVAWTRPKKEEVSVARRSSVALLDALVPRKA